MTRRPCLIPGSRGGWWPTARIADAGHEGGHLAGIERSDHRGVASTRRLQRLHLIDQALKAKALVVEPAQIQDAPSPFGRSSEPSGLKATELVVSEACPGPANRRLPPGLPLAP